MSKSAMSLEIIGRILLVIGLGIAAVGGLMLIGSRVPFINQLFNLPGDIRIETGNLTCLFPIATMIILSIVLTIVLNIIARFINR